MCGENDAMLKKIEFECGSPPRVWGKQRLYLAITGGCRITPTCVGKTTKLSRINKHPQDHPHVCGENDPFSWIWICFIRITPTCVGKTSMVAIVTCESSGSPPRVWGKLLFAE